MTALFIGTDNLMTVSALQGIGPQVVMFRTGKDLLAQLDSGNHGEIVAIALDLQRFNDDLPAIAQAAGQTPVIGYAPHVATDLIAASKQYCTRVVARKGLPRAVAALIGRAGSVN